MKNFNVLLTIALLLVIGLASPLAADDIYIVNKDGTEQQCASGVIFVPGGVPGPSYFTHELPELSPAAISKVRKVIASYYAFKDGHLVFDSCNGEVHPMWGSVKKGVRIVKSFDEHERTRILNDWWSRTPLVKVTHLAPRGRTNTTEVTAVQDNPASRW